MQKGLIMLLLGAVFVLLGLFTMPMRRVNAKQNLVDNPIGWGLFGFGLSSFIVGISTAMKERQLKQQLGEGQMVEHHVEINKYTMKEQESEENTLQ